MMSDALISNCSGRENRIGGTMESLGTPVGTFSNIELKSARTLLLLLLHEIVSTFIEDNVWFRAPWYQEMPTKLVLRRTKVDTAAGKSSHSEAQKYERMPTSQGEIFTKWTFLKEKVAVSRWERCRLLRGKVPSFDGTKHGRTRFVIKRMWIGKPARTGTEAGFTSL
jgi:hypothetical protein